MAATGYTPIYLYYSGTATNVPLAANLGAGELAINAADGNLFYKNTSNAVVTIPVLQSSATQSGWLSSTDWSTFNSKQPAGAYLTSVTSDAPLTGAGTSASHLSMPAATGSVNGYLTSTDWTTFNSKQPAGTYVTSVSGTAPVVSSGGTTPAISMAAATSSVNGYLTSTDWSTFNNKSPAAGSSSITTVGTITSGTWHGSTIGTGYGGTGLTSFTANGIVYASSTSALTTSSSLTFDGTNITNNAGFFVSTTGSGGNGYTGAFLTTYRLVNLHASGATQVIGSGEIDIYTAGGSPIVFSTSGAEAARIHSSGGVSIGNTTDPGAGNLRFNTTGSNGIYFGTSSQLNDYEEGTWTPTLTALTAGDLAITYQYRQGTYRKIGKLVYVDFVIVTTAFTWTTASSYVLITGLPYTVTNTQNQGTGSFSVFQGVTLPSGYTTLNTYGRANTTQTYLSINGSGKVGDLLLISAMPSGTQQYLYGSICYPVA